MRIVHIEDYFFPSAGYQINLLSRLQVLQGHDVTIVASELDKIPNNYTVFFGKAAQKDKEYTLRTGVKIIRVPIIGFYSGRSIYYPGIFKVVDSLKPDVLFVHGEDTLIGMQFIWRASKLKYPLVLDCHMIEMASMNRFRNLFRVFYQKMIAPIIVKNKIPLIRVVDVDYVEKCLGIPLSHTTLLSLGTDTDLFKPDELVSRDFRAQHGIGEKDFVVLYAGKLDRFKNGLFLADAIKEEFHLAADRKVVFIIIGNTEGEYGRQVEKKLLESRNRIVRFPTQDYFDLSAYYPAADLAVFPMHCSLSFFDVQSCGLPVLFEKNEINNERSQYNNGFTFIPGDINDFRLKLKDCAEIPKEEFESLQKDSRKYILDNFNFVHIADKITKLLENEVFRYKQINPKKK